VAAHQKKARRRGAALAVIDESGLLMAPLVRRTWAPRGQTPLLRQRGKHREKVSVAAAVWLPPRRDRLGFFFRTLVNAYFNNARSAPFLEALLEELGGRLVVVWDGENMHKGDPIRELLGRVGDRLRLERFPPYAPMLDPVEPIWSWLKYGRLCNFAARDAAQLNEEVVAELTALGKDQGLLRRLFHASDLPLPRTLLS
jgi:transposase